MLAATRTEGQCLTGAPPTYSHRSQSQCEQLASALRNNAPCFIKSHCHARPCVHACVSAAGVHVCGGAAHDVNGVDQQPHACATCHATHATWLSHAHARAPRSVRTSTLHVGGCMFLAEPAMFLLTWCFCCSSQCFALCLLGEPNVFACVWSQI